MLKDSIFESKMYSEEDKEDAEEANTKAKEELKAAEQKTRDAIKMSLADEQQLIDTVSGNELRESEQEVNVHESLCSYLGEVPI